MEKLKPCPHCGGEAKMLRSYGVMAYWKAECIYCYCGTGDEESEQEAIDLWNKRITDG